MKTKLLTALWLVLSIVAAIAPANAYELRGGIQNVQVRDIIFKDYSNGFDEAFDNQWWRFFNLAHLQYAAEVTTDLDLIGAVRFGVESGRVEGFGSELLLAEPVFGIRKRYPLRWRFEAYGQATLSVSYMRATFSSRSESVSYDSVFPILTPSAGLSYFLRGNRNGQFGVAADVGYSTPAFFEFRGKGGVDAGDLRYGGVTYGAFLVWRPKSPDAL